MSKDLTEKNKWKRIRKGVIITIIIGGILFLIVHFATLKYLESKEDKIECGEAVKYYFESPKNFYLQSGGNLAMDMPNGSSSRHFPICEEVKIYCYEEGWEIFDEYTGKVKTEVYPDMVFIAEANNSVAVDCIGNNCIYEKINTLIIECRATITIYTTDKLENSNATNVKAKYEVVK